MPQTAPHSNGAISGAASIVGSPSPEEAAAIAAAIELFLHDAAPPAQPAVEGPDPWTRVAMLEGVMREDRPYAPHPWINT